jgi:hypothetical protein
MANHYKTACPDKRRIMETKNLDKLSSAEIDDYVCAMEKLHKECITSHETVEQERLEIQRQILELQLRKKEMDMGISKSKTNLRQLEIDLKIARSKFWAVKNENR